jgi:hypothetical protein
MGFICAKPGHDLCGRGRGGGRDPIGLTFDGVDHRLMRDPLGKFCVPLRRRHIEYARLDEAECTDRHHHDQREGSPNQKVV